jgi:hypothetical protein
MFGLALLASACGSASAPRRPASGGESGEDGDSGGTGGGTGGGGKGGAGGLAKPDAASAPDSGPDSGASPDAGADGGGAPATADCTAATRATLLCDTLRALPKTIKETGLFPAAPDFLTRPASLREYVPDPPLWSDGLDKQRFLLLPQGTKIDNSDRQRWQFPVGTVFIKTFFDQGGEGGNVRPVETRLIRRIAGNDAFTQYDYAVYKWNPTGADADLVDFEDKHTPVMVTVKALGAPFSHDIPTHTECLDCHEANAKVAQTFIGFDELRLGAVKNQLQGFAPLFTNPLPAAPATITDPDVRLQRIKQFVFGNCVHCHNGGRLGLVDLHPDMFVANTVGKPIDASGVSAPAGWLRVVPGKPEMSVLYVEARRTMLPTGLKPMPTVGVAVPEKAALDDLRAWIMGLPAK